jgi:LCP family protein required for cell wall assembly
MARQEKKGKKKGLLFGVIALQVFVLILLFAGFKIYTSLNKINQNNKQDKDIKINEEVKTDKGYRNIAIFGVDSRSNSLDEGTHSDTIIIASLNKETKDVKLVSIYRDTYSNIPDIGYKKINASFFNGGYSLALSTINKNFDLDIKEYVTVNFKAVVDAVDLVGGITLDITDDELHLVNGYVNSLNEINGTSVPHLKSAGTQLVNGTQATAYSRIRYTAGADFKRTERQRTVIQKVFEKVKDSDLATVNKMIDTIFPQVATNLNKLEILSLAKDVFSYDIVDQTGFPFEKDAHTYDGVSYVFPINLSDNVTKLHEFLFTNMAYTPSATVQEYSDYIESIRIK